MKCTDFSSWNERSNLLMEISNNKLVCVVQEFLFEVCDIMEDYCLIQTVNFHVSKSGVLPFLIFANIAEKCLGLFSVRFYQGWYKWAHVWRTWGGCKTCSVFRESLFINGALTLEPWKKPSPATSYGNIYCNVRAENLNLLKPFCHSIAPPCGDRVMAEPFLCINYVMDSW